MRGRKPGILRGYFGPKAVKSAYFLTSERVFSPPLISRRSFRSVAPAAMASPGCDASVLPAFGQLPVQVIPTLSHVRPVPLGGLVAQEGGCEQGDRHELNQPQVFPAIWIFVRKNPGVQTFARNFFGDFIFRTGEKPAGKISRQLFLRFSTFAPKIFRPGKFRGQKKYGFSAAPAWAADRDLRRRSELVV